ncbi:MAG TPA: hypothetical protein VGM90_04320 [Kofleriaceae bacterium]|jgi:hypothetical protein
MRTTLLSLVIALSAPVAAEPIEMGIQVGVGAPTGGFGVGVREGPLEAFGEIEAIVLGPAMAGSVTAQVHYELTRHGRWGLYVGPVGGILGAFAAGAEGDSSGAWGLAGAVVGAHFHRSPKRVHDFEVGSLYGICLDMPCDGTRKFVSLQFAWRLHFYL